MKKAFSMLLICFLQFTSYNQQTLSFSKKQMYDDYDSLIQSVIAISPHIPIKKDLWNYDAIRQMKDLRKNIDTIQSDYSFSLLIDMALNCAQDLHTNMLDYPDAYWVDKDKYALWLPISYVEGRYLLKRDLLYQGDTIPVGAEITHYNGIPVHQYVNSIQPYKMMNFDLDRMQFYENRFYDNVSTFNLTNVSFTFQWNNKNIKEVVYKVSDHAQFVNPIQDVNKSYVEYWDDLDVLYIKLFRMDNSLLPRLTNQIKLYNNEDTPVRKAIIDVRDNTGGNDGVWISVINYLLAAKMDIPLAIDGNYPDYMSAGDLENTGITLNTLKLDDRSVVKRYRFYSYTDVIDSLVPADSSIRCNGPIVVVGNENIYSSGASIMIVPNASETDNIYSVGRSTNMFLGAGFAPVVKTLPNSGIRYRVAPSIEVTNAQQKQDLMNDKYDITIPYTLNEFRQWNDYNGNTMGASYLKTIDPFIREALKL